MKEIVDLDSESAATIFSFINIERDSPKEELGMIELENSLSQAIWKMFDSIREDVAVRLNVEGADLLLADARVIGVRIDGHQIINPSGFTGKDLELLLALTMVRRDKFVENKEIFEGGSVRAFLAAKDRGFDNAIYVETREDATYIFEITPKGVSYVSGFDWGRANLTDSFQKELGILPSTAGGIYLKHATGDVSSHVEKRLDKVFYEAVSDFINGVASVLKERTDQSTSKSPAVYMRTFFPIPTEFYNKRFSFGSRRVKFVPVDGEKDVRHFVEDNVHTVYDDLNQLARRRIKWLMPTV